VNKKIAAAGKAFQTKNAGGRALQKIYQKCAQPQDGSSRYCTGQQISMQQTKHYKRYVNAGNTAIQKWMQRHSLSSCALGGANSA
jgi:hypothetical protein